MEAIIRLHEDKMGVTQESRDFGLPSPGEADEWGDDGWNGWWSSDWDDHRANEEADNVPDPAVAAGPDQPLLGPGGERLGLRPWAPGSSPSHHAEAGPTTSRPPSRASGRHDASEPEASVVALDEMSVADSFIMNVLRGYRLLQAAGLSAEEKRDILAISKNSLDSEVIASALQSLWDEQLLGQRYSADSGRSYHAMTALQDESDAFY